MKRRRMREKAFDGERRGVYPENGRQSISLEGSQSHGLGGNGRCSIHWAALPLRFNFFSFFGRGLSLSRKSRLLSDSWTQI